MQRRKPILFLSPSGTINTKAVNFLASGVLIAKFSEVGRELATMAALLLAYKELKRLFALSKLLRWHKNAL